MENTNCNEDLNTFNEIVWLYGSMGDHITTKFNELQKAVIAKAWAAVAIDVEDDTKSEEEIDKIINSYYDEFKVA